MKSKYYNRDLSWLLFDNRVIDQAYNNKVPLLEKLRFLSIASNNLDEFFRVRMHNVYSMITRKKRDRRTGLDGVDLLSFVYDFNSRNIAKQYQALGIILDDIKDKGIFDLSYFSDVSDKEKEYLQDYYLKNISKRIKVVDFNTDKKSHNNLNILLCSEEKLYSAEIPDDLNRLVETNVPNHFVLLEDLIINSAKDHFRKHKIIDGYIYRLTFDKNKRYDFLDENLSDRQYLKDMNDYLTNNGHRKVTRVEFVSHDEPKDRVFFSSLFGISKKSVYEICGPLDLRILDKLFKKYRNDPKLVFAPFTGLTWRDSKDILGYLNDKSILVNYPYDSFDIFLKFLKASVHDSKTTAIKMSIYRTEKQSHVVSLLKEAASKGIQVTVIVELRARFDEQHNLEVAEELENAGCKILYGDRVNKVHAKICLIEQGNSGYVQIGTGNYNAITSKVFSDVSFFTSNSKYVNDARLFFDRLAGKSVDEFNLLDTSPNGIKQLILHKIRKATRNYLRTGKGEVFIKVNGLTDIEIINGIYGAARLGLPFRIIVRGPCSLKLGLCGEKEDIEVKSIVGELLEHSRIYKFDYGNGEDEIWISSADLMTRNLDRRVEIAAPLVEESIKKTMRKLIKMYQKDTANSYYLNQDGEYIKKNKFFNVSAQQTWLKRIKWRKYV
ncbi:polyphosphate kinase 1 [Companilactobacillus baiquanensis]|uniref:Polyphosphate kinase n=1 Tax=Companilactobacillus baiquanensis TaxID=2486005 RepID=A0ABW1UVR8_9LACO|nr:polyphosphate kinase 1 [Companilactobacillus baiquanensis]